jgi:hypothetical protein
VNRGSEFSGTFGIDAAQLDRFAPLQMDHPRRMFGTMPGRRWANFVLPAI